MKQNIVLPKAACKDILIFPRVHSAQFMGNIDSFGIDITGGAIHLPRMKRNAI